MPSPALILPGVFLSTPSARRATVDFSGYDGPLDISIHALREEGDHRVVLFFWQEQISIHALREEGDKTSAAWTRSAAYFYPRPPRGGRRHPGYHAMTARGISIHALREEGDGDIKRKDGDLICISIHALREEGDLCSSLL